MIETNCLDTPSAMTPARLALIVSLVAAVAGCAPNAQPEVVVVIPPPDGNPACYQQYRVPLYTAVTAALEHDRQVERARSGGTAQLLAGGVLSVVSPHIGGLGGQLAQGAGAALTIAGALAVNARADASIIQDVSLRFSALLQCRQAEARRIRNNVRVRRTAQAEGRRQLAELRDLMTEDAATARQANDILSRRNAVYDVEVRKIGTDVPDPVARQRQSSDLVQARQTIQSNQQALTEQASAISRAPQSIPIAALGSYPTLA